MKPENQKPGGGLAILANLANYTLELAKQATSQPDKAAEENIAEHLAERAAIMEYDGGLPREQAEAEAQRNLKVYRYRLRELPNSDLILIAPGTSLDEAREGLRRRFGNRLVDVR